MIDIEMTARDESELDKFIELLRNTQGVHPHDFGVSDGKRKIKVLCFWDSQKSRD